MVAGLVHHPLVIMELADRIVTKARALVDERTRFARQRHELQYPTFARTPSTQAF
jgi:hypothetical protein